MSATVLPFPLARRQKMIARHAQYAAELRPKSAERFIQNQLRTQAECMRRRGISAHAINLEIKSMESAIRNHLNPPAPDSAGGVR